MSCRLLALGVLLLLPALPASAVTVPWTGTVTVVELDLGGAFTGAMVGDEFTGSFTYTGVCPGDCLVEPFPPDETNYVFPDPDGSASITGLGITRNGTEASVNIQNDHVVTAEEAEFANDLLQGTGVSLQENDVIDVWTAASELDSLEWEISFVSLDASFFDDQSFQANPPPFSEADIALFQIVELDASDDDLFAVAGLLVPEPSSAALLGAALAALAASRRRPR